MCPEILSYTLSKVGQIVVNVLHINDDGGCVLLHTGVLCCTIPISYYDNELYILQQK